MANNVLLSSVRMSRTCLTEYGRCDKLPHKCISVDGSIVHRLSMDALGCCHRATGEATHQQMGSDNPLVSPNYGYWRRHMNTLDKKERKASASLRLARESLADAILKNVYGAHSIDNAFAPLCFGANSDCHRATVADLMHTVEEGIFKHVITCVLGILPPGSSKKVDRLVAEWFSDIGSNRSGERVNYPRVSFARGICSTALLTADETVGQMFILALLLYTKEGREVMQHRFDPNFDTTRNRHKTNTKQNEHHATNEPSSSSDDENDEQALGNGDPESTSMGGPNTLTQSEVGELLYALDMEYIKTHCLPRLPSHHKQILKLTLDIHLKRSLLTHIQHGLHLPKGRMGYKQVPTTQRVVGAPTSVAHSCTATNNYLTDNTKLKFPDNRQSFTLKSNMDDTSLMIQVLLAFHSFLKYGGHTIGREEDQANYRKSFHCLMTAIVQGIGREANTRREFKIQKFLECSHFLQDRIKFGPSVGHNTDTGERGLKQQWAKKVAKTAQKRGDTTFRGQVAKNIQEFEIL